MPPMPPPGGMPPPAAGVLLRQFGDHGFGGDQESRDGSRVLDRRTNHLGRVDDALGDQVAVFSLRSTTPLRPPLQTPPQGAFLALFVGFTATMTRSDFSCPCIIGFGSSPSRCGPSRSRNI